MVAALPIIAMSAIIGGGIVKTMQSVANDKYQANVARMNQSIAAQNSQFQAQAANTAAEVTGMKASQQLAGEKATAAARGVAASSGSAADTLTSQRQLGAFSQMETMAEGQQRTYGYETQEAGYSAEHAMAMSKIPGDLAGGIFNTVGQAAEAGAQIGGGPGGGGPTDVTGSFSGGGGDSVMPSLTSSLPTAAGQNQWLSDPKYYDTGDFSDIGAMGG